MAVKLIIVCRLVINAMKLQKCRPSFFDARDAIIQADQILTGGENFCVLWKGFGDRGLGPDADVKGRTDWGGGIRQDVRSVFSCLFYLFLDTNNLGFVIKGLLRPCYVQRDAV